MSIETQKDTNLTTENVDTAERLKSEANEYFKSNRKHNYHEITPQNAKTPPNDYI